MHYGVSSKIRMKPNLLVIRSPHIDKAVKFYEALGMSFELHSHGSGPMHYACDSDGFVFEIYPTKEDTSTTAKVRLGFRVDSVDEALASVTPIGGTVISEAKDSPWGRRAVCKDLDGHTVEFTQTSLS